jgi:hypothetical protein
VLSILGLITIFATTGIYLSKEKIITFGKNLATERFEQSSIAKEKGLGYYVGKVESVYQTILGSLIAFSAIFIATILVLSLRLTETSVKIIKIMLAAIIFFDLSLYGWAFFELKGYEEIYGKNALIDFFEKENDRFRVFDLTNSISNAQAAIYDIELVNLASEQNLANYVEFLNISLHRYKSLNAPLQAITNIIVTGPPELLSDYRVFDLLNVKYFVFGNEVNTPNLKKVYADKVYVYENKNFMPRAFVVKNVKVTNEVLDELKKEEFDPREYVIIEEDVDFTSENTSFTKAEITDYSPNEITVNAEGPGFLVLSEMWYPGWKAYENKKELKVYRANHVLKAVYLEEGKHTIRFVYEPLYYKIGKIITLITIIILILGLLVYKKV